MSQYTREIHLPSARCATTTKAAAATAKATTAKPTAPETASTAHTAKTARPTTAASPGNSSSGIPEQAYKKGKNRGNYADEYGRENQPAYKTSRSARQGSANKTSCEGLQYPGDDDEYYENENNIVQENIGNRTSTVAPGTPGLGRRRDFSLYHMRYSLDSGINAACEISPLELGNNCLFGYALCNGIRQ